MSAKNNEKASELRKAGNSHYKSSNFFEALVLFNKGICNAVPASEELALGFANRSAVYFELGKFEFCLENIDLALDCGYPREKVKSLMLRREKCLDMRELQETDEDLENFFKLSHPPNEKIPFVADCIEMRESEKFGRHLVATRSLKTGDTIIIEEPFHRFIHNNARFSHCANCLKSETLNLFPCLRCNFGKLKLLNPVFGIPNEPFN